ncbi:hypothetical protein F5B19DRAFT_463159 [Rostrohypoxylon terebratum]|nr:hypothetical protein F5B19DRAFT_463159 [Rostrohypoxylon terebratum]
MAKWSFLYTNSVFRKLLNSEREENGDPNSFHLKLGAEGYRIQSRVLRIPTRWGAFSSGPYALQAYEGSQLALLFFYILLWFIYVLPALALANWIGLCSVGLTWITSRAIAFMIACYWLGMIFDPRRSNPRFHDTRLQPGWREQHVQDRLRQLSLRQRELNLWLRRNALEREKLQLEKEYRMDLQQKIEKDVLDKGRESVLQDMIDIMQSTASSKSH